jgi:hypothetical protein
MTSRIRLVGLSTATAKQQHRTRSTKLGAPSLWEVSIDPVDTPEGREPLRGGFGGQGNQEHEYSYDGGKTPHRLGVISGNLLYPSPTQKT